MKQPCPQSYYKSGRYSGFVQHSLFRPRLRLLLEALQFHVFSLALSSYPQRPRSTQRNQIEGQNYYQAVAAYYIYIFYYQTTFGRVYFLTFTAFSDFRLDFDLFDDFLELFLLPCDFFLFFWLRILKASNHQHFWLILPIKLARSWAWYLILGSLLSLAQGWATGASSLQEQVGLQCRRFMFIGWHYYFIIQ